MQIWHSMSTGEEDYRGLDWSPEIKDYDIVRTEVSVVKGEIDVVRSTIDGKVQVVWLKGTKSNSVQLLLTAHTEIGQTLEERMTISVV